jgi:hypothetical protein
MRDIYKQASRAAVWLGPLAKAEDANLARRMLHFLAYQNYQPSASPDVIHKSTIMDSPRWDAVGEILRTSASNYRRIGEGNNCAEI